MVSTVGNWAKLLEPAARKRQAQMQQATDAMFAERQNAWNSLYTTGLASAARSQREQQTAKLFNSDFTQEPIFKEYSNGFQVQRKLVEGYLKEYGVKPELCETYYNSESTALTPESLEKTRDLMREFSNRGKSVLQKLKDDFKEWTEDIFDFSYLKDVKINPYEKEEYIVVGVDPADGDDTVSVMWNPGAVFSTNWRFGLPSVTA